MREAMRVGSDGGSFLLTHFRDGCRSLVGVMLSCMDAAQTSREHRQAQAGQDHARGGALRAGQKVQLYLNLPVN